MDLRGNFIVESYLAGLKFQGTAPRLQGFNVVISAIDPTPQRNQFSALVNAAGTPVSGVSYT